MKLPKKIIRILKILGPGFITGAADDDPSGIASYSQTGAQFGYGQLWMALFSFPFMTIVQEMCARIGMVTGEGLSGIIKKHYSKRILYVAVTLLLIANTINIGADLGAMASAAELILGIPYIVWLLGLTALILILEIFVSYKNYARFLKYLTFSLFAYILTAFIVKQDWTNVLHETFIPSFSLNKEYLMNIVAILGTTISPYMFFWQASEEVEEKQEHCKVILTGKCGDVEAITGGEVQDMRLDTAVGMLFSNLIMFFIIVTTASTLGSHGITQVETATQAAQALRPLAGNFAFLLFAVGIIGTGLLAVPILAGSAAYAVSEALSWQAGLDKKFVKALGFYGVIIVATIIGVTINFSSIKPFTMLYYTAIINGIVAPPLLVLVMLISNNKKIMGKYVNGGFSNIMGWMVTIIMAIASIAFLISLVYGG